MIQQPWMRLITGGHVGCSGAHVGLRQIQGEGAAGARRAPQLNLTTKQAGQFAADGEAQTGAAVFAAGAGIRLLEGFKDDPLLLRRDTDSGVRDFKGHDSSRGAEDGMVWRPTAGYRRNGGT